MEQKMKSIQYAGYSILKDGTWKFRTATDQKRVFQLESFGETVYMIGIKPVETKSQAAKELLAMSYMAKDQACVDFFVQHAKDENPFKRSARVIKITVPSVAMIELTGATVKVVNEYGTAKERKEANKRLMAQYETQMAA
jgi:hypothetical protein